MGESALASGETATLGVVTTPDPEDSLGVMELLAHKPGDWQWHLEVAFATGPPGLATRFYVAVIDGRAVSNVLLTESADVGILGHVFTRPEHRRKGLCQAIFDRLMPDFRTRGGLRILLGTGYDSPAYWIYHRNGFRSRLPESGMMIYESRADYPAIYYALGPVVIERFDWRHWPPLAHLLIDDYGEGLQSLHYRAFGPFNFEGHGVSLAKALAEGAAVEANVLVTPRGSVVGFALLRPDPLWQGFRLLDLVAHPDFAGHLEDLVGSLSLADGPVQAWLPAVAAARRAALERHGFRAVATVERQLPGGGDAVWYRKG